MSPTQFSLKSAKESEVMRVRELKLRLEELQLLVMTRSITRPSEERAHGER